MGPKRPSLQGDIYPYYRCSGTQAGDYRAKVCHRAGMRADQLEPAVLEHILADPAIHHWTNIGMTTCTYSSESVGLNTPGLEEVVVSNATCPRSNTDSTSRR